MNPTLFAKKIRELSLRMVHESGGSHIGSALSIVDILSVLYNDIMNVDLIKQKAPNRDHLILSKGHACVSLYATLGIKGFFNLDELKTYGQNGSNFMNHISHKVPGVEFSTGSLGHGLPYATGIALGLKMKKINSRVYVILGDGELAEGSNWEAMLFASHQKLDNLFLIIDNNNLQSLTTVEKTLGLESYKEKINAFGFETFIIDGHNYKAIKDSLSNNINASNKPTAIIAKTVKGKGVSFMENSVKWHYSSPSDEELHSAIYEINNEE